MKIRLLMVAAALAAACVPAAAQSVSGLSTKKPESKPVEAADVKSIKTLLELANALATATPAQRDALARELAKLSTTTETGTAVNLAVPAGATAAVGEDGKASAGPRLGFQAWKPDDFFAGAFFTFDTAPTLNGDVRKAGQFVRDPPNTGSSFLVSGNRMFLRYRCGRIVKIRPPRLKLRVDANRTVQTLEEAQEEARKAALVDDPCYLQDGDKQDALIMGLSARLGVSATTLQHKPAVEDGADPADPVNREASIFHGTISLLLTSRTFKTDGDGEYQFGLEIGKTFRRIGGDAADDKDFLSQPDVFGHPRTNLGGYDATFFARLNGFQPFVRVTRISRAGGTHVPGLTGVQASFGVNVLSSLFQTTKENKKAEDKTAEEKKSEGGNK